MIAKKIQNAIVNKPKRVIILSGVREQQVHSYLTKNGVVVYSFEIIADAPIRFQRLLDLEKVKDAEEFLLQEIRETELGVNEVMLKAPFAVPTSPKTNPTKIAEEMIRALEVKGIRA